MNITMSSTTAISVICSRPLISTFLQSTKKAQIGHVQHLKLSFRLFSSTAANRSKIGRLPLSVPPGVTVEVLQHKEYKRRGKTTSEIVSRIVEVRGPLGSFLLSFTAMILVLTTCRQNKTKYSSICQLNTRKWWQRSPSCWCWWPITKEAAADVGYVEHSRLYKHNDTDHVKEL